MLTSRPPEPAGPAMENPDTAFPFRFAASEAVAIQYLGRRMCDFKMP